MEPTTFSLYQFTQTKCHTPADKLWFVNQFVAFVNSGFKRKYFTNLFYKRLSNTFGHIAHYDQEGFWNTFFTTPENRLKFLKMVLDCKCIGDPKYTYSDVEKVLKGWLIDNYPHCLSMATTTSENKDVAMYSTFNQYEALCSKYLYEMAMLLQQFFLDYSYTCDEKEGRLMVAKMAALVERATSLQDWLVKFVLPNNYTKDKSC